MISMKYKRSSDALSAEVADDVVALHIQRGSSYGMERVTADVWRLLEASTDLDTICAQLMERYEVDEQTCRREVGQLMTLFEQEGLVETVAN